MRLTRFEWMPHDPNGSGWLHTENQFNELTKSIITLADGELETSWIELSRAWDVMHSGGAFCNFHSKSQFSQCQQQNQRETVSFRRMQCSCLQHKIRTSMAMHWIRDVQEISIKCNDSLNNNISDIRIRPEMYIFPYFLFYSFIGTFLIVFDNVAFFMVSLREIEENAKSYNKLILFPSLACVVIVIVRITGASNVWTLNIRNIISLFFSIFRCIFSISIDGALFRGVISTTAQHSTTTLFMPFDFWFSFFIFLLQSILSFLCQYWIEVRRFSRG